MISSPLNSTNFRLMLPETIWLESEHFDQAKAISNRVSQEVNQWQTYLNALALLGFESWLKEQIPNRTITLNVNGIENAYSLRVGELKLCLIATEQVLDEVINIPRTALDCSPELAAHLYVVLEVSEEQEQAIVRGFLRHDELVTYCNQSESARQNEFYSLPLSALDAEINHLVIYIRYSPLSTILVPRISARAAEAILLSDLEAIKTRLSRWLQGTLDEGWQAIDSLVNLEANLALSTRHSSSGAKGVKLINFGMQLGNQTVALLVTVVPEEEKLGIGIQVLPAGGETLLPPHLKLTLLSEAETILQEVQSRDQDNYIQLKRFKGKTGTRFSIEVSLNEIKVKEAFEL